MHLDHDRSRNTRSLRYLILAAIILSFLLIVAGGIVRVTNSSGACLDWPTCMGNWTPPAQTSAIIDYTHRAATVLAFPFILSAVAIAWRRFRQAHWITLPLLFATGLMIAQIALGARIALLQLSASWASGLHLLFSLLMQASLVVALVSAFIYDANSEIETAAIQQMRFRSPFARLTLVVLALTLALMISGAIVAGNQASIACSSWPLCGVNLVDLDPAGWLNLIHRSITALSGLAIAALLWMAWRTQRSQTTILVSTTATAVLFFAQALLGAKMTAGFPSYLLGLHQATAVASWSALAVLVATTGFAQRTKEQEHAETTQIHGRKGLAKDLLLLTKPIVVALLLVTTFAGMVIGAQAWPSLSLTFWTLLGGFMAAGGSGAVNQYIDRYDDSKMQRTQKRPLPAGRLTPAEGLAFGVAMLLSAFFILTAFVNFLAALLSLGGMIYYVLLYSIVLKKTTVQNIVIGGGAGAIPPLVGWAAATGSLNFPSLLLFAVIFMWTPPHFWALALVRRKDYARAGVPMLPVVRGEKETRWQILIYTVELVALTLLLPVLGLGGAVYLIGAGLLGLWLLLAAWKVWKEGGNKLAWKMYRYSSMYLAFLFFVLMLDRLL